MEEGISKNFINIIKGVIISIVFTLIFLFIFSIILTYTTISESFITPTIIVITAISIFIGSSIGNIKMKKNGLFNGALIGGIYLLSIYLLSGIINQNFSLNWYYPMTNAGQTVSAQVTSPSSKICPFE